MMDLVIFSIFALIALVYLGGKIDLSFAEQEADEQMGILKAIIRARRDKAQTNGGDKRRFSHSTKGAAGHDSGLVAPGLPQK